MYNLREPSNFKNIYLLSNAIDHLIKDKKVPNVLEDGSRVPLSNSFVQDLLHF
jgi:hypothetical protein